MTQPFDAFNRRPSGCLATMFRLTLFALAVVACAAWIVTTPSHGDAPVHRGVAVDSATVAAKVVPTTTSTVVVHVEIAAASPVAGISSTPTTRTRAAQTSDAWDDLALCESGDTNAETGNGFWGYFQFVDQTWQSISGLPGHASDYSRAVQLEFAQRLQSVAGWGQWPACSRKLGLR